MAYPFAIAKAVETAEAVGIAKVIAIAEAIYIEHKTRSMSLIVFWQTT